MRNFTKIYLLIEFLDILTTMVGMGWFGMIEGNVLFADQKMLRAYIYKLTFMVLMMSILEWPVRIPERLSRWRPALEIVGGMSLLPWLYPAINNIYIISILA